MIDVETILTGIKDLGQICLDWDGRMLYWITEGKLKGIKMDDWNEDSTIQFNTLSASGPIKTLAFDSINR